MDVYDEEEGRQGRGLYYMDGCQIIEKESGFLGEYGLRYPTLYHKGECMASKF